MHVTDLQHMHARGAVAFLSPTILRKLSGGQDIRMAAGGGYNAPGLEDTRTGFGSESANGGENFDRNLPGVSNQPLFGTDYKR